MKVYLFLILALLSVAHAGRDRSRSPRGGRVAPPNSPNDAEEGNGNRGEEEATQDFWPAIYEIEDSLDAGFPAGPLLFWLLLVVLGKFTVLG